MKLEDNAVYSGKNTLEFCVLFESLLIAIKSGESCANICVSGEECLEYVAVMAGKLKGTLDSV
jgi:hypothetical protein